MIRKLTKLINLVPFISVKTESYEVKKLCQYECEIEYNHGVHDCPCNAGCPNGCPCPNYDCDVNLDRTFDSVLLLNEQTAVLRSLEGDVFDFDYSVDDASYAYGHCSIVFNNENFILGWVLNFDYKYFFLGRSLSRTHKQQISKLVGCDLRRIGTLNFDIGYNQSCATGNGKIFVCFGISQRDLCYRSTDPLGQFTSIGRSSYGHYDTNIAASDGI